MSSNFFSLKTAEWENTAECHNKLSKNVNGLTILHLNIRSMDKHFEELIVLVNELKNIPDLIVCTETRNVNIDLYSITGYNAYYNDGNINKNDGVITYVKSNLKQEHKVETIGTCSINSITITKNQISYEVMGVYKSPSINEILFTREMDDYLSHMNSNHEKIIIGDINIDILNTNSHISTGYLDMMAINGFIPLINKPTRVTSTSATCIDHCFVKTSRPVETITTGILHSGITDHFPIIMQTQENCQSNRKAEHKTIETVNYKKFRSILMDTDWSQLYNLNDCNKCAMMLHSILMEAKSRSSVQRKIRKETRKPWITPNLVNLIKKRDKLHKMALKSNDGQLQDEFKHFRNIVNTNLKKARYHYFKDQIQDNKSQKDIWNMVNNFMLNRKQKGKNMQDVNIINPDGQLTKTDKETANIFNEYFTNVGQTLAQRIPHKNFNYESMTRNLNSFLLLPVSVQEIFGEIMLLKEKKSPGYDGLTTRLIKNVADIIASPLAHIINISFQSGIFPDIYKRAMISAIYKSGSKTQVGNYRPISVICKFGKIMEKSIHRRLTQFLTEHNIINNNQFGFREKLSTEDALTEFVKVIYENVDKSKPVSSIFIDLAKAFDTLDHKHLIKKLEYIGIRGIPKDLIENYLSHREQTVKINNVESESRILTYGVPQGTVLGPLLFILYMNDLFNVNIPGKIISFADDTSMIFEGNSWNEVMEKMKIGMTTIQDWFSNNSLTVNIDKTNFIFFGSHIDAMPVTNEIIFPHTGGLSTIKRTNHTKYLGVIIDGHLRWDEHLRKLNKKLRYLPFTLKKLRNIVSTTVLASSIYHGLFLSILRYGILTWGGACQTYISPIEILQKAAIKNIYNKPRCYPTKLLFQETRKLEIRKLFMYTVILNLTASGTFQESRMSNRTTRATTNLKLRNPKMSKSIGQRSFTFIGHKIVNEMPTSLRSQLLHYEDKNKFNIKNQVTIWLNEIDIRKFELF